MAAPVIITIVLVCLLFALCCLAEPLQHSAAQRDDLPLPNERE